MHARLPRRLLSVAIAGSTAVLILTASLVPFLTPAWIAFGQDRADAAAWTSYTPEELRLATDGILVDLVLGPPDFDVAVDGVAVLTEAERGHMRDVRGVFLGLWALAAVAAAVLVLAPRAIGHAAAWAAAGRGAGVLALAVVAVGAIGLVAFDALFDLFHRIAFPGGNWTFDPRTDRLVQLFPYRFWFETSLAVGAVVVLVSGLVTLRARMVRDASGGSRVGLVPPAGHPIR